MGSVKECVRNLPEKREKILKENIYGNERAEHRISLIPVWTARKSKHGFVQKDPNHKKGCSSSIPENTRDLNDRTFTITTLPEELIKLADKCSQSKDRTRPNEDAASTEIASSAKPENVPAAINDGTVKKKIQKETPPRTEENYHQSTDKQSGKISVLPSPSKYTAHSGMKFLPSPKKMTLKLFSSDVKEKPLLRRSKTECESRFRQETTNLKMFGKAEVKNGFLAEKSQLKEAKKKTGGRSKHTKSISLDYRKLPEITEPDLEKPSMSPKKISAHSGVKVLPNNMILKPFHFETKRKSSLRRSKTEIMLESRSQHSKENRKNEYIKKSIEQSRTVEELDLSNVTKATLEKSPVFLHEYQAHSGLKFVPSPERTIVEPFSFDDNGTPRSRSKTENMVECSFRQDILKPKKSAGVCNQIFQDKAHLKDSKRKTPDTSKASKPKTIKEQKLADIAKTVTEEAPVSQKNYAGHSGLTFKLKPSSKTTKTFDMKPKNTKSKGFQHQSAKTNGKEDSKGNK